MWIRTALVLAAGLMVAAEKPKEQSPEEIQGGRIIPSLIY